MCSFVNFVNIKKNRIYQTLSLASGYILTTVLNLKKNHNRINRNWAVSIRRRLLTTMDEKSFDFNHKDWLQTKRFMWKWIWEKWREMKTKRKKNYLQYIETGEWHIVPLLLGLFFSNESSAIYLIIKELKKSW